MKKHLPLILTVIVIATFILQSDVVAQLEYEIIGIYVDSAWEKEGYLAAEPNMSMCHKVDLTEVVEFGGALHLFLNNGEFFYTPFPMVSVTDPNNNLGLGHLYMQELEQYKWYRAGIKDGVGGPAAIFASAVSGFGGNPSIFVCPPIWPEYPATATPTVSPAGCSFLALPNDGSIKAYTFSGDYRLHSHQGTALWARGGPDASNKDWTTLPSHPDSAAPVVPAGSYELFKAGETTPNADLLVCRVQATPTPTVTPTVTPTAGVISGGAGWEADGCFYGNHRDRGDGRYVGDWAGWEQGDYPDLVVQGPYDLVGQNGYKLNGWMITLISGGASLEEYERNTSGKRMNAGDEIMLDTKFRNGIYLLDFHTPEPFEFRLCPPVEPPDPFWSDGCYYSYGRVDNYEDSNNAIWRGDFSVFDYPDVQVGGGGSFATIITRTDGFAGWTITLDQSETSVDTTDRSAIDVGETHVFQSSHDEIYIYEFHDNHSFAFHVCPQTTGPTPTATRTAVATPTGVPTPDWWPTNTPIPSETPTPTPTPTQTPTPTWDGTSLVCPAGDLYLVSNRTVVQFQPKQQYQIVDNPITYQDSTSASAVVQGPGVFVWKAETQSVVVDVANSGTTARLYLCPLPAATTTPTVNLTATPAGGFKCDICMALGQIVTNLEIQINLQQTAIALQQTPPPISVIVPTTDPRYEKTKITLLETIAAGGTAVTPGTPTATGTRTPTGTPVSQAVFISVEQSTYSVREDAGSVSIVIIMSRPLTQSISVSYATAFGSAGAADFVSVSNSTTFDPGQTRQSISITIVDDTLDEPDEDFTFELSNPQIAGSRPGGLAMPLLQDEIVSLGRPASVPVTIIDNDWPTIPTFDAVCVIVPATATTGTTPWPTFRPIPTMRALPALPGVTAVVVTASPGVTITVTSEAVAQWMAPAETMDAWSAEQFGSDAWATGQADGQIIADEVGGAIGWLSVLLILGPLAAWVPLIIIRLNVSLSARVVLTVVRFVRAMLWR
jgi:hypothetical protein